MIELKTAAAFSAIFGFIGLIASAFADLLGGYDVALEHLLLFMVIDFVAGTIVAAVGKSDKTESGKISSGAMLHGFAKKIVMILVVIFFNGIDTLFEIDYVRNAIIYAFILYEGTSILEHAVAVGLPKSLGKFKFIIENLFDVNQKK